MATTREEVLSTTQETDALSCITYPAPAPGKTADFDLKMALLSNLPKFRGCNSEDPDNHLKRFQFVCDSMCPKGADINILKLRAFFFSLKDRALTWFLDLPRGHIDSWDKMVTEFLTKFMSSRRIAIRKQIAGIQQSVDESYCTYSERFNALVASFPNHGMSEAILLRYFYEGLLTNERERLDAFAGGCFMDKTPEGATQLLKYHALNSALNNMTTLFSQNLQVKCQEAAKVCEGCSMQGHVTDQCIQLIENGGRESLDALRSQPSYNSFSNTYNSGLWNHAENVQQPQPSGGQFSCSQGFYQRPQVPQNFMSYDNYVSHNAANSSHDKMLEAFFQWHQTMTQSTQAPVTSQEWNTMDIWN